MIVHYIFNRACAGRDAAQLRPRLRGLADPGAGALHLHGDPDAARARGRGEWLRPPCRARGGHSSRRRGGIRANSTEPLGDVRLSPPRRGGDAGPGALGRAFVLQGRGQPAAVSAHRPAANGDDGAGEGIRPGAPALRGDGARRQGGARPRPGAARRHRGADAGIRAPEAGPARRPGGFGPGAAALPHRRGELLEAPRLGRRQDLDVDLQHRVRHRGGHRHHAGDERHGRLGAFEVPLPRQRRGAARDPGDPDGPGHRRAGAHLPHRLGAGAAIEQRLGP